MCTIPHYAIRNIIQFNQGTDSQHSHICKKNSRRNVLKLCYKILCDFTTHHSHSDRQQITVKLADNKSTALTRTHNSYEISTSKTGGRSSHWSLDCLSLNYCVLMSLNLSYPLPSNLILHPAAHPYSPHPQLHTGKCTLCSTVSDIVIRVFVSRLTD